MLDESPNTGNLLILSGAGSLNKKSSLVKLAEDSEDMAAVACYEDKNEDICSVLKSMGMTLNRRRCNCSVRVCRATGWSI